MSHRAFSFFALAQAASGIGVEQSLRFFGSTGPEQQTPLVVTFAGGQHLPLAVGIPDMQHCGPIGTRTIFSHWLLFGPLGASPGRAANPGRGHLAGEAAGAADCRIALGTIRYRRIGRRRGALAVRKISAAGARQRRSRRYRPGRCCNRSCSDRSPFARTGSSNSSRRRWPRSR